MLTQILTSLIRYTKPSDKKCFDTFHAIRKKTKVSQNSSAANSLLDAALATDPFDLSGFGEALHTFQDSYSHEDFASSHIRAGTKPDDTTIKENQARDLRMARMTYLKIKLAIEKEKVCPCTKPPKAFNSIWVRNYLGSSQAGKQGMVPETQFYEYRSERMPGVSVNETWHVSGR